MYWTEGRESAAIMRANMDGSNMTILIQNHNEMAKPRSLVIDFFEEMMYWTEEHYNHISRARIDGTGVEKLIETFLPHPYCLTQYKDFIYWGDQQEATITRASKYNGGNRTRIEGNIGYIMDMKVFHNSRQVGWNKCGDDNGGCSHLCLALPEQKYTCACPDHYTLDNLTKSTCISKYSPRVYVIIIFSSGSNYGGINMLLCGYLM